MAKKKIINTEAPGAETHSAPDPAAEPFFSDAEVSAVGSAIETAEKAEPLSAHPTCDYEHLPIVVLGSAEALPLLDEIWQRKAPGSLIIPIEVDEDPPFSATIDRLIANELIPDTFVLVPANCFPTHRVGIADLVAYRVRRMKSQSGKMLATPRTGLPFLFKADAALKTLKLLGDTYDEEAFLFVYNPIAHPGERPEEIGMTFGNTVSYAIRRPKCLAVVAEALVRKRFICTTGEGFVAIKDQLALLVKNE